MSQMLNSSITFYEKSDEQNFKYSVLIPSWNNLPYLKVCIRSIRENSSFEENLQIIVVVNEGKDGTLQWLEKENSIDYIHIEKNIGICYAVNIARKLIKAPYVIYMNDDMYALPNWDTAFDREVNNASNPLFYFSATMIEPHDTGNLCVVVKDYGDSIEQFDEKRLLSEYRGLKRSDWNGASWPPSIVSLSLWDAVGGLSAEFSPGMFSDPDFSKKLYNAGVRNFKGIGDSLVYHFGSKSTKRIKTNKGRVQFLCKWGITARFFSKNILRLGQNYAVLPDRYKQSFFEKLLNNLKHIKAVFSR